MLSDELFVFFVRTALSPIEGLKRHIEQKQQEIEHVRTALSPIEGLKQERAGSYLDRWGVVRTALSPIEGLKLSAHHKGRVGDSRSEQR